MPLHLVLADHHRSIFQGLALVLRQEPDFEGLVHGYDGLETLCTGCFWDLQLAALCA
jgi:hypothetical protein